MTSTKLQEVQMCKCDITPAQFNVKYFFLKQGGLDETRAVAATDTIFFSWNFKILAIFLQLKTTYFTVNLFKRDYMRPISNFDLIKNICIPGRLEMAFNIYCWHLC